ncbi:MAG: GNAT family N-acetyltransferase [Anaerolineales bacterium]|jgi:predicted GNAT superfamily acetyltransferase
MADWTLRILETPQEMQAVEQLQRLVWPDSETDIVPAHLLLASAHNGGLVIGAFPGDRRGEGEEASLAGFVFGFPGMYATPDGPRLKHCSHMLGVDPGYRGQGLGFALKRAQWQMVRYQGLDRITWTYDPLLSRNAYLNVAQLGAVCNTYLREEYGTMRDALNRDLPSDRFQVDWWVNTQRVERRLSRGARLKLDLAHFLAAGAQVLNPTHLDADHLPRLDPSRYQDWLEDPAPVGGEQPLVLVEIPSDYQELKASDLELAHEWRLQTRLLFETLFERGYLVTDFIHLPGALARSYYVLSFGESTL